MQELAEQGDAEAQFKLGVLYANGEGVPKDDVEAVKCFHKAAEQGYAAAQSNLGALYILGRGVPKDYAKAYMWLNLAAAKGYEQATKNRDMLDKRMTKEQISESQKLTREWLELKAKENGE